MTAPNRFRFRAWHKEIKRMIPISSLRWDALGNMDREVYLYDHAPVDIDGTWPHFTEQLVLMQSTGLLDKNGVEIFEGDRLAWHDEEGPAGVIEWSDEDTAFLFKSEDGGAFLNAEYCENFRVVGNIYESPNTSPSR